MAFWEKTSFVDDIPKGAYTVKLLWMKRDDPEHYFQISKDWKVIAESAKFISGKLVRVWLDSYETEEWGTRNLMKFLLQDGNEMLYLAISFNMLSRSLVNCLASADKIWELNLSLYMSGSWYKSIGVRNDNQKLSWKYSMDEINKLKTFIKDPDTWEVVKTKYDKVDEMYQNELTNLKLVYSEEPIIEEWEWDVDSDSNWWEEDLKANESAIKKMAAEKDGKKKNKDEKFPRENKK